MADFRQARGSAETRFGTWEAGSCMAGGWRAVAKAQVKLAAFQSPALGIALATAASPKRARTLIVSDAPRRPRQVGQRRSCSGA